MAVKVTMTGSGTTGDNTGWSVTEVATPLNIASNEGSSGSISLSAKSTDLSKFIINNNATLTHDTMGSVQGTVESVDVSGAHVNYSVAPLVSLLSVERTLPPIAGTLNDVFYTYVNSVASNLNFFLASQARYNPVTYGGWTGDVWTMLKALCAATGLELVFINNQLIAQDAGVRYLTIDDNADVTTSMAIIESAQFINIVYQNYASVVAGALVNNYSQNPSLETNAVGWNATNTNGSITAGRAV